MRIKILNEELFSQYERFILSFKGGSFFYSLKYKCFLEELLSCESSYYIALEDDQILAVYPMMAKSGKFGTVYNSLPFYGSHGGILSNSGSLQKFEFLRPFSPFSILLRKPHFALNQLYIELKTKSLLTKPSNVYLYTLCSVQAKIQMLTTFAGSQQDSIKAFLNLWNFKIFPNANIKRRA